MQKLMPTLRNERARACHDLAFAEVISYNRANLERVEQNESRQQDKQQSSFLVPFANKFPKNTKLYKQMTTRPGEGT